MLRTASLPKATLLTLVLEQTIGITVTLAIKKSV